jgi:hypothetical protein
MDLPEALVVSPQNGREGATGLWISSHGKLKAMSLIAEAAPRPRDISLLLKWLYLWKHVELMSRKELYGLLRGVSQVDSYRWQTAVLNSRSLLRLPRIIDNSF